MNNVQARKLNEPVGFLVSSLNKIRFKVVGKIKGNTTRKKEKQKKVGILNLYLCELCCFVNKMKNYFICCSESRKHIIFYRNADSLEFFK